MPQVVYSTNALDNLERLFQFLLEKNPAAASRAATAIREAVNLLSRHPLLGRALEEGDLRELVISWGDTGYVALYRFVPARKQIRILAIRHQRELDYFPWKLVRK